MDKKNINKQLDSLNKGVKELKIVGRRKQLQYVRLFLYIILFVNLPLGTYILAYYLSKNIQTLQTFTIIIIGLNIVLGIIAFILLRNPRRIRKFVYRK